MSKRISDEIISLKIVVNGDEAQARVANLERENNKLYQEMEKQKNLMKELSRQRKKDTTEYKQAEAEIKRLSSTIADNNRKIDEEIKAMNIMSLTMEQLRKRAKDLQFTLSNMNPNSDSYKQTQNELSKINTRMGELRSGSQAAASSVSNLADRFNHYSGLATAVLATLTGVALSIQSTIDLNNKLADAQSAVAKTTGLSKQEVKELTQSFSELDTRTKNIDLLKIAEIGGRLGVPKNEIKDFVKEVDKAYVALGDSFSGGVEAVANKIGKIKGLFKETKDLDMATAINQIGSSLNDLGANGAASEDNIAEFAVRVGALPETLKPTVAEAMALGAAFEESGIDAERSSTAYSNFVRTAAKESQAFADVMGITKAEVEKLLNQDPLQFFLKFAEGAKGLEATDMAKMLEHLKLNDQYVVSIIGAASENTDLFRKSIELSNQSLAEATSLQKEFNEVNNNAAAIYEKVRNKFIGMFASETVANTLNWLIQMMGRLLGVTIDNGEKMSVFTAIVVTLARVGLTLGASFVSVSLAMAVYNNLIRESAVRTVALDTIEKARASGMKLMLSLQSLWNYALGGSQLAIARVTSFLGMQTTATNLQTAAQHRLNAATAANPIGAIIALIDLAVSAYMTYSSMVDDVVEKQKSLSDMTKEAADSASAEISQLDRLYKAATDTSKGKDAQREAVEKLQKLYPSYFGNMSQEEIMAGRLKGKYLELRNAILEAAKARAVEKELEKIAGERLKLQEEKDKQLKNSFNYRQNVRKFGDVAGGDTGTGILMNSSQDDIMNSYKSDNVIKKTFRDADARLKQREDYLVGYVESNKHKYAPLEKDRENQGGVKSNYSVPTDSGNGKGKTAPKKTDTEKESEKEARKLAESKKKLLDEMEKWGEKEEALHIKQQEYAMERMKDGYEKEIQAVIIEEQKKHAALEKEKYSQEEMDKLDKMISSEKTPAGKAKFEEIKAQWQAHNDQLTAFQMQESEISMMKIRAIKEKYDLQDLKKKQEKYEQEIALLKTQENNKIAELTSIEEQKAFLQDKLSEKELAKITTWEEGKKAIQAYYQKETLKQQQEHLDMLIKELERIPPANLTEEQTKALEEMRAKLAGIRVELTGIRASEQEGEEANFSSLSSFGGGNSDIFGLSQDQWETMFTNTDKLEVNIQKVGAAIRVAQNLMSTYYGFVKANQEAELRRYEVAHTRKQKTLEAQLAAGIISQQEYKHATIANENELAMKKYQLELDAAKREKAMKIADTISNTAMAIMSIWSKQGANPITAGILTGLVTAMGAVQVATIASQPLPQPPAVQGAEDGYYPVIRKQDGKLFNARKRESRSGIYNEPTMLVGEQGKNFPELVVSGRAMKRIDPKIQNEFMSEVARVEGFENGLYPKTTPQGNDDLMIRMMEIIQKNTETMERLEQNGVRGVFEKSARVGKDLEDMQKEYNRLVDKNRH